VYVSVLAVATLVSLLGISAVTAGRLRARASGTGSDILEAQAYAQAALDLGRLTISLDSNWRNTQTKGWWAHNLAIGSGTYSLWVYDPNGNGQLNQNTTDPVILIGYGTKGTATQQVQVQLSPNSSSAMSCLTVALCGNGTMTLTGTVVAGNQTIGGNGSIVASGATIAPAVQGVSTPSGGTYSGGKSGGNTALVLPSSSTIFNNYTGTAISFGSIPTVGGIATLSGKTFSSSSNPVGGSTDPNGIYIIDCGGSTLNMSSCHVVGTLILKNPGASGSISGSNYFEPGTAGNPVLMVSGNINIKPVNTSFTLSGTTYASAFKGVVYVSGNLATSNHPVFNGSVVVNGNWSSSGSTDLNYDSSVVTHPPAGFGSSSKMLVVSGSFK
jgi:hypothetical protein